MNHIIWNLFYQTGNIETYLLLKSIENEQLTDRQNENEHDDEIASFQTKM